MARTRTVVDCGIYAKHRELENAGLLCTCEDHAAHVHTVGDADTLPGIEWLTPHTTEEPFSVAEEAAADAQASEARARRIEREETRAGREAAAALLREQGVAHPDPLVQAAARLLAGG